MFVTPVATSNNTYSTSDPGLQVVGTDIDQFGSIQDYLAQTDPSKLTPAQRASEIAQQAGKTLSERTATTASRGYTDLLKSVVSPDSTLIERGQAVMDLGGKALKDIYTANKEW
jgi:hypothetical protein